MKLLKKLFPTLLAPLMIAALCVPALAQTTSIALDGEVYSFVGGAGSYQANGKTFIIGHDSVTVRAPGEADRVLPLTTSTEEATVSAGSGAAYTGATYTSWDDDIEIAWDGSSAGAVESTGEAALMAQDSTAVESGRASAENMRAFCAPYAEFGLSYDAERDTLVYMGKRVRHFTDVRQSNGKSPADDGFQGKITCSMRETGEIDLETIRDYTQPDAAGDGKLLGLHVTPVHYRAN